MNNYKQVNFTGKSGIWFKNTKHYKKYKLINS